MADALSEVRVKLGRADELLSDVGLRWAKHQDSLPVGGVDIVTYQESVGGDYHVRIRPRPLPHEIKSVVGEFAVALKSALDYLVYALARADSGETPKGTQFPIVETPDEFSSVAPRYLRGVSSAHVALIEGRQPYQGDAWAWLRLIRDLGNMDKHRHLNPVVADVELDYNVYSIVRNEAAEQRARRIRKRTELEVDVNMHLGITLQVVLPDGSPGIRTLEQLLTQAEQLIEAFKPEF